MISPIPVSYTHLDVYKRQGLQLKFGIYNSYGMLKDKLQDLLLYYSANEKKMITFAEYVENMKEDQKEIYFASGESYEKIDHLPTVEMVKDKGFDILYMIDNVDEFCIQIDVYKRQSKAKSFLLMRS